MIPLQAHPTLCTSKLQFFLYAPNNHQITKTNGKIIGQSTFAIICDNELHAPTRRKSNVVHDIKFPVNLNDNEITFAIFPITSSNPTNIEITISKIFTTIFKGIYKKIFLFPLSTVI